MALNFENRPIYRTKNTCVWGRTSCGDGGVWRGCSARCCAARTAKVAVTGQSFAADICGICGQQCVGEELFFLFFWTRAVRAWPLPPERCVRGSWQTMCAVPWVLSGGWQGDGRLTASRPESTSPKRVEKTGGKGHGGSWRAAALCSVGESMQEEKGCSKRRGKRCEKGRRALVQVNTTIVCQDSWTGSNNAAQCGTHGNDARTCGESCRKIWGPGDAYWWRLRSRTTQKFKVGRGLWWSLCLDRYAGTRPCMQQAVCICGESCCKIWGPEDAYSQRSKPRTAQKFKVGRGLWWSLCLDRCAGTRPCMQQAACTCGESRRKI